MTNKRSPDAGASRETIGQREIGTGRTPTSPSTTSPRRRGPRRPRRTRRRRRSRRQKGKKQQREAEELMLGCVARRRPQRQRRRRPTSDAAAVNAGAATERAFTRGVDGRWHAGLCSHLAPLVRAGRRTRRPTASSRPRKRVLMAAPTAPSGIPLPQKNTPSLVAACTTRKIGDLLADRVFSECAGEQRPPQPPLPLASGASCAPLLSCSNPVHELRTGSSRAPGSQAPRGARVPGIFLSLPPRPCRPAGPLEGRQADLGSLLNGYGESAPRTRHSRVRGHHGPLAH